MSSEFSLNELIRTDFNLLLILSILVREGSVRKTAEKMHVGSPSISMSLNKLRDIFKDPLMVRHGKQMVPTPRAISLVALVDPFLQQLRLEIIGPAEFNPSIIQRVIRFAIAEDLETLFLPAIYQRMAIKAPNVKIVLRDVDFNSTGDMLLAGEAEVILSAIYPQNIQNEPCKKIYNECFKVLCSKNLLEGKRSIDLETYLATPQFLISPRGHMQGIIDQELNRRGMKRDIASTLTKFSSLPEILSRIPYISNVPSAVADFYAKKYALISSDLPFPSPEFNVGIAWQRALDNDQFTHWFISEIENIVLYTNELES